MVWLLLACASDPWDFGSWDQPAVQIRSPAIGDAVAPGELEVTGVARHVDHVDVNGVSADLDRWGRFRAVVPASHGLVTLDATGSRDADADLAFDRRAVLAGAFADPDAPVTDAMVLRVNQPALDALMLSVQGQLDGRDLTRRVLDMNPVFNQDSFLVTAKAVIDRVHIGGPRIRAIPAAEALRVEVRVPDLLIQASSWGRVLGAPFDVGVRVECQELMLAFGFALGAHDGRLSVDVPWVDLNLSGFDFDVSFLPDLVEEMLLVDAVQGAAEDAAERALVELLNPALDAALDGVDLSFSTRLMGAPLDVDLGFADAWTDADGLAVVADVRAQLPARLDGPQSGYLHTPAGALPAPSTRSGLSMALSDNLLNNLLFQVWRAGLIDVSLSTDAGTLSPELAAQLQAETASVRVRSHLPPVVGSHAGDLLLELGELEVLLETPGGGLGDALELSLNLSLPMSPRAEHGALDLGLGEPLLEMMARDNDWGASAEATTVLLEDKMPVETLLAPVHELAIPLPEPAEGGVERVIVVRDDNGAYTNVHIEL
jgi:hypothetical protein